MGDKQRSRTVSTKQQRIAELARQMAGRQLTSLSHHIELDWMYEAYRVTRKDGAVGIDGESAEAFAEELEGNLQKLLDGAKTGQYRAPAVRRVNIPKGKGISPLLANIYLHEVLDLWFERDVRPRMHGGAFMVRYADDVVMCFAREDDARRVLEVLPKRLGRYGLSLHPEKTRMVEFRRPPHKDNRPSEQRPPRPGTFDFLGFTRYWGRSRKGRWVVKG
jgi:retron-type reverse transcriptase